MKSVSLEISDCCCSFDAILFISIKHDLVGTFKFLSEVSSALDDKNGNNFLFSSSLLSSRLCLIA